MLVAIFVGWYMRKTVVHDELLRGMEVSLAGKRITAVWFNLVKFAAPVLIFLVFLSAIGVLK
ncbi:MAG: hypothetical protein U5N56_08760 [Candidatus Marinimicrobia bacterium]|nr:hypothetical protein [Candidatus Neomarinimicrobiota bacterium]